MMNCAFRARALLLITLFLFSCARYQPIPWREAPGRADAVQAMGERLVGGLEEGVEESKLNLERFRARPARGSEEEEKVLRVVVAAFPEARTGVRTAFSRQVEGAVRRALGRSKRFRIIDGAEGVAWQEARIFPAHALSPLQERSASAASGEEEVASEPEEEYPPALVVDGGWAAGRPPFGDWREEMERREESEEENEGKEKLEATPEAIDGELDSDHPLQGPWNQAKVKAYGEDSAIYAASILGADAAVFGAYALGPGRVRVWVAVVLNSAPRAIYYTRGLDDIFGLPERILSGRIYPAYSRDQLPRSTVLDEFLAVRINPHPRMPPRQPRWWGEPALEVKLEEIDNRGERRSLTVRNMVEAKSLVVGRLAARAPRYVYAFAMDKQGEAEEIFSSLDPRRQGWARQVEAGKFVPFAARMIETGRIYRLYFVSAPAPFEGSRAVQAARRRLGLGPNGPLPARSARAAASGAPPEPWYVDGGQDRLLLDEGWDQQVFWFFRQESR